MTPELLQIVCMGESGAGKSEFFATFPKPMLVLQLDPVGKATPYFKRGIAGEWLDGAEGQRVRQVMSRRDESQLIIQCEFFLEPEPTQPVAFNTLLARWQSVREEVAQGMWATVCLETFTSMELAARYRREFGRMGDPEKSNIFATADAEMMLTRLGGLPCNVCVAAHIDAKPASMNPDRVITDKKGNKFMAGGQLVATPMAPGRLQKGIAANFASEMYRIHVATDKDGNTQRFLQTQNDGRFACASRIGAPDGCDPDYKSLWTNWTNGGEQQ